MLPCMHQVQPSLAGFRFVHTLASDASSLAVASHVHQRSCSRKHSHNKRRPVRAFIASSRAVLAAVRRVRSLRRNAESCCWWSLTSRDTKCAADGYWCIAFEEPHTSHDFAMSSSKSSLDGEAESWVHVGGAISLSGSQGGTPGSVTPHVTGEEYIRLLREAARESNNSSTRVSPRSSPKSPPNSPVQGTPLIMEWQSYYMNSENKEDGEFFIDWSSRPDQAPPKNWSFRPPKRDLSLRYARVGNSSVFSRRGLCTLFLTNLLSLLLGTGVGIWLSKYGFFIPAVKVR